MQKIRHLKDRGIFSGKLLGLFICLCLPCIVIAQHGAWYFTWTMGTGMLFDAGNNRQLQVSIPYVIIDATGNVTQNSFTSKAISPYSKPSVTFSPFNWDLGNEREFVVFRLWGDMVYNSSISLGYGRNYYFDLPWVRKRDRRERSFVLKPSINIGYDFFDNGSPDYLGTISNTDRELSLLNMASGPTYSVTSGGFFSDNGKSTVTDSTNTLDLYYKHHQCSIIPKLTISNNPYKHLLHWEASIAYNQPFYEQAGIVAYQNNTNRLNNHGQIKSLDAYNMVTTFGGSKITAAPFAYSGFSVEITLGIAVTKLRFGL